MPPSKSPSGPIRIQLTFPAYPLQASLGALARKWALLVLMNIALSRAQRFNALLRTTPGMSKRVLAMRLRDLERDGFIERAVRSRAFTRWQLTRKGADVLPVLLTLIHFSGKWTPRPDPSVGGPTSWGLTFDVAYSPGTRPRAVVAGGHAPDLRRPVDVVLEPIHRTGPKLDGRRSPRRRSPRARGPRDRRTNAGAAGSPVP
jgi:DNA-binding HxlR family transcriptional regulator